MKILNNPFLPLFFINVFFFTQVISRKDCATNKKTSTSKLICYYSTVDDIDGCYCTHVILPSNSDVKIIERVRERAKGVKVYVSVNEFNQELINLLKSSKVDGLEINLKKLDSKNDISDFISTVKSKIGSDLDIALSVPSKSDLVVKYFDFKALSKHTDLFLLQTAFLGASTNVTFHPSRLSGMWDMQNTDSVVDLISGLGAPLSKLVIAAPVQAFQFTLQSEEYTAPGSPAVEVKSITRNELCKTMHGGKNWTLERDEDQAGPYIFRNNQWIAFEDLKSIDIKAKYSRVRGLAGIALKDLSQDGGAKCGSTILEATYNGLSRQARAPRGAVLHSLEREILESPTRPLDSVHLSPYRISRIIDTEGKIHVTRQDSRTEFQCSRQGYFVHPRSCNRFYRCVKFDQRSDDFNVFEFDCPAGLAFDERVEVCVWPGSLPHGTPCSGSSEIAPVPRKRFECPSEPGYYADPENCRWFFACLDHGKSPLEAYEFRCPFGLGFDGARLVCEWPWLVPKCANGLGVGLDSEYYYGGASGYNGYAGNNGIQSSGVVLQNYDGLGALGTVHLGGISGKIDQPIATVYSNVGGALGLGYQNNEGYIVGGGLGYKAAQSLANAGLLKVNNGAGYQASGQNQEGTLYAASDLDSGNANIQYSSGTYDEYGQQKLAAGHGAGPAHTEGAVSTQSFTQYTNQNGADSGKFLINANGNYDSGANAYAAGQLNLQYQGTAGQYQDNLHLVQGGLGGTGYTTTGAQEAQLHLARQEAGLYAFAPGSLNQHQEVSSGYQDVYLPVAGKGQQSGNYAYQPGNIGLYNGANTATLTNLGQENRGYIAVSGSTDQRYNGNSAAYVTGNTELASQYAQDQNQGIFQKKSGGAVSTQSFTHYHSGQDNKASENYGSGISGNINIVGGGYSAVGTLAGVQVSNNGDVDEVKAVSLSSTPSPISVTTYAPVSTVASVPIVTAIPVPGIKTAAGFETFKGGVIANIPELQYKVKSYEDAGFLANISSSFANFVVTTPATVAKEVIQQTYSKEGGYLYGKPGKVFEEAPLNTITVSTARPFVTVNTEEPKIYVSSTVKPILAQQGYVYEKPSVVFQENPIIYSTPRPAVSTEAYQKYDTNGGYKYERPSVEFEEKPQGVVDAYSTLSIARPAVYVPQQEQIYVSSTPAAPEVSSVRFIQQENQQQGGYYYNKPAIAFEEGPKNPTVISKFAIRQPNVEQTVHIGSYYYEKPVVKFEERPIVVQQQPTVINEIPPVQVEQKAVVGNYAYQQPAQPAVVSQYYRQQPVIKQQPIVPLYRQPELLTTYTYQPPVQKTIYKQPESSYTYQNIAQQSVGLTYDKPQVTLVTKPTQTYSYQPSGGNSYQYTKFENNLQHKLIAVQPQGYEYPKPAIAFEDRPQIGVVSTYQYTTPQPNIIIKETKAQEGYVYEKPVVTFDKIPVTYSTPKPTIAVQPAVVTSYFNNGAATSAQAVKQDRFAHSYPQPEVKFPETSVAYSTPKPFVAVQPVTPAVVTSYFNIQSSTPTPNVLVQEPLTYSTPKPVVHQPDGTVHQKVGYTYPKPEIRFEENPVQPALVSSYNYIGSTTPQPNIIIEKQQPIYNPQPQVIVEHKPAVATSYFHHQPSQSVTSKGYAYPKPSVQFVEEPQPVLTVYENKQPVQEVPFIKKTAYVTGQYQQNAQENHNYQQNFYGNYKDTSKVGNYIHSNYEKVKQAVYGQEEYQQQPQVVLNYIQSTPKPSFVSTIKTIVTKNLQPVTPATVTYYDSRLTASPEAYVSSSVAPEINIVSTTSRPISRYSFSSLDDQYQYNQNRGVVKSTTPERIYGYIGSTTPQPKIIVEEQPITYTSKPKVIVQQKPAVVTSYFHQQASQPVVSKGYDYPKPAVQFVEEPQPVYTSYGSGEQVQEVPFVKKTAYVTGDYQQNAQENYNYQQSSQGNYQHTGKVVVENYLHPNYEKGKQAVFGQEVYQQQPQVVLNYVQSTPKPSFVSTIKSIVNTKLQPVTPATVTFYDSRLTASPEIYVSSTVAPEINIVSTSRPISRYSFSSLDDQYQNYQNRGAVKASSPEPIYDYIGSTTPQPNIIVEEQPITYTYKPKVIVQQKPAVVTSYFHQQASQPVVSKGYDYPKPAVQFVEEPQPVFTSYDNREPVKEVPFVKKTAYVTGDYQQNAQENYIYQQSSQGNNQHAGKVVVENYLHPNYEKVRQELFGQKVYHQQEGVQYQQPQVVLNYVQSTPRPSLVSTVKEIAIKKLLPVTPATVTFYDSRYTSTPESYVSSTVAPEVNFISTTSRPISRFSFSSLDDQYQYNQNIGIVQSTSSEPERTYLPVTSRVRVTSALPKVTTAKIVDEYVVPEVTTLTRDYLPVRIRTKAPAREYLPVEITTPSREYLPSRQRVVTSSTPVPEITTLFREYLPVKSRVRVTTTGVPLDDLSYTSRRPTAVRVVRPVTVIKQNDAHPLLSAKLGAQCTCVSNNLRLRKKQKIIIVNDDDDDDQNAGSDDDGYIVDDGGQGTVIENYSYEPQKLVDITPTPQVYVQSTSVVPQTYIKKRVKIRPVLKQSYLPVTQVSDVFYKQDAGLGYSTPSDGEIVKAVRTGLKLVKQAAKEGAREGAQEALSGQHFDRYGPGGVRSRSETLQGTIDCQRAGLFRHPTECNKFYACRWDCTKSRFTLHVFNCPVHLTFDNNLGACNWPSQGPACVENTLITSD